MRPWERFAALVCGRWSWAIALLIAVAAGVLMAMAGEHAGANQSPVPVPTSAESARAAAAAKDFAQGGTAPVLLVASRSDGAPLTEADLNAVGESGQRVRS